MRISKKNYNFASSIQNTMAKLGNGAYATHPGEVIKDELEARKIPQRSFAQQVNMSYSVLNEILNGHRPLTTHTALMFEAALDIPADALMYMQTKYNLQTARSDNNVLAWLSKIPRVAALW